MNQYLSADLARYHLKPREWEVLKTYAQILAVRDF